MGVNTWDERMKDVENFYFSSDDLMNTTLGNGAVVEVSTRVSTIPMVNGHGYAEDSMIYITGTTNYDGLWTVLATASATINIGALFVAETVTTGDVARPAFKLDVPGQFLGYELHLAAACGTVEDFEIHKDADRGTAWDTRLVDQPMNSVKDVVNMFDKAIYLEADDIVYCTFPNTDDNLFGLTLYARRLA